MRLTLDELAVAFGTDKGPQGHNYTPLYERHLRLLRDRAVTLLEIGIAAGASLRMWDAWFSAADVIGVDIAPEREVNEGRIRTHVCDVKQYEPMTDFDIIVDDGSHDPMDITVAARRLMPRLRPGGWYVIEDWAVVPEDSSAFTDLLGPLVSNLIRERPISHFSEVHIYPQIAFLRRHPLKGET